MRFLCTYLACAVLLCACDPSLTRALRLSGENRPALDSVLTYFKESGDGQKYLAAKYLVANMPLHYTMVGAYDCYYDELDSLAEMDNLLLMSEDSLRKLSGTYAQDIRYAPVIENVSARYLIGDINLAFDQWRCGEWATHLNFDEFCEWLLPYTCSNFQPLMDWRNDFYPFAKSYIEQAHECDDFKNNPRAAICRVNNRLIEIAKKQTWLHSNHGFPVFRPATFANLPGAACDEYCEIATLIMRSKGIPVGIDFTNQWPDRYFGHYWCVYPNLRGKNVMFNPFSTNPDYPHFTYARFSKVFRRTYAYNKDYLKLCARNRSVPDMFSDPFFKDVTEEYEVTDNLVIPVYDSRKLDSRDVYIATFNNLEWKPMFWGRVVGGKARFRNMGRQVTYLVMGYVSGVLQPISDPFHVDVNGNISFYKAASDDTISFTIMRKYPMFNHVMVNQPYLHGGIVEASDTPDFKSCERVCEFPEWELTSCEAKVYQSKPYRYWRLNVGPGRRTDVADVFFYSSSDALHGDGGFSGCERILMSTDTEYSAIVDGDPLTYVSVTSGSQCIFDAGTPVTLGQISCIRRGDGNAIVPGDRYRINWWQDNRWNECAEMTADGISLKIDGVPSDALYLIEGLSRGVQNRIFTYDDNHGIDWR